MSVKSKYFLTVLLLVFLALIPSGCFFCGWKQIFCFNVTYSVKSGEEFPLYSQRAYQQFVLIAGIWYISGLFGPAEFSKSNAVDSIPSKLNFKLSRRNANGKELEKRIYKVRVNKITGKIRKQTFPFKEMTINPNEEVRFSVTPTGDLSQSSLNLTVEYIKQ